MEGTLKIQDLGLDKGTQFRFSISSKKGIDCEVVDVVDVDGITLYGSVDITVEKRCGQRFEEDYYPLIRYNSVAIDTVNLNNLNLKTKQLGDYLLSLDRGIPGTGHFMFLDSLIKKIRKSNNCSTLFSYFCSVFRSCIDFFRDYI